MKAFVDKYSDRIHGVLSCFDRMLFRGYLPIMSGWSMAQLLQAHEIDCASVKPFLLSNAEPGHEQSGGLFVPGEEPGHWPGAACKAERRSPGVGAPWRAS